jgi:hypothetical protein
MMAMIHQSPQNLRTTSAAHRSSNFDPGVASHDHPQAIAPDATAEQTKIKQITLPMLF